MLSRVAGTTVAQGDPRPSDRVQVRAAGVQPTPKLGEWVAVLIELLEKRIEAATAGTAPRLSACSRSYAGMAMTVRTTVCTRFVKAWRATNRRGVPAQAFVPMSFAPRGEAFQFDWSHETITLQGLRR